jgi:hypothetical protein
LVKTSGKFAKRNLIDKVIQNPYALELVIVLGYSALYKEDVDEKSVLSAIV